jgi:serine/threonine protein kinase
MKCIVLCASFFKKKENDSPYFVMEFINGESLADILKREGQRPESAAIDIFVQIMDGLAYAHEQNVIHRDLKPSNAMLFQQADKPLQVKILNFGIAKITGKDTLNTMTLTGTGEIFGSPLSMSPEQCLGRTVDLIFYWLCALSSLCQERGKPRPYKGGEG